MEVEPVVSSRAGVISSRSDHSSTVFKRIDDVTILGSGSLAIYEFSLGLTSGRFILTLSEKTAMLHKSRVARGNKALYSGVLDEYSADGEKIDVHTFHLCPIAAINTHFKTNFNLSGKGTIGQMNKAEFGAVLTQQVVEPVVKQIVEGNATVLAAIAQINNSIGQMTENFSAKLDASA